MFTLFGSLTLHEGPSGSPHLKIGTSVLELFYVFHCQGSLLLLTTKNMSIYLSDFCLANTCVGQRPKLKVLVDLHLKVPWYKKNP